MAGLILQHVTKAYPNGFVAVKDLDLEVKDGEFLVLTGAEGCGKSTALRVIAGLEDITSGVLLMDGEIINEVEPRKRDIAMVFRNYELYPQMNVYENLAFGLKLKRMSQEEIDRRIQAAAELLELTELLEQQPKHLTDLQRQRVALARAAVREPKVFLMDEPFANLDAGLRQQMWEELSRLHKQVGITLIYVTDDPAEALKLGQRIAYMKDGAVEQADTPQALLERPENVSVAGYFGTPQIRFGDSVVREENGRLVLLWGKDLLVPEEGLSEALKRQGYVGKTVTLGVCDGAETEGQNPLAGAERIYVFDRETGMRVE